MPAPPCSNFGRRGWSPNGGIVDLDRSPSSPYGGRGFDLARDTYDEDDCDQGFSMIPSADRGPPRRPQPTYNTRNLCNDLDQNSSSPQIGRPLNPFMDLTPQHRAMGFQQRRQPPSEVKLSSAGRAFNSGEKCCDDMFQTSGDSTGPGGRQLNPMDFFHGCVEPGSPQWVSLYMDHNFAAREGFCSPPNDMQNRSPSSNRYDCDPCADQNRNANCDPNANQQLYRNQNFGNQGQNACPCAPRGGASPNQPRQMQPWNQPDCSPPRMMPPNYGPSPQYNIRDNSPKRPCPPCPGAGVPSNANIPRGSTNPCSTMPSIQAYNPPERSFNQNAIPLQMNQTFNNSSQPCPPNPCPPNPCPPKPCPPPPQQNCCPRPMPQQQQQQQQQARFNSPDCSPNRMGRQRSNASFKPDCGPKATSTPKPTATASNLSMRELCNRKLRELQLENLVRDQYAPGIIQETLDGCENFNCISFDLTLGQDAPETRPQVDPLTLVEAFALRIDFERKQLNCARERNAKGKDKETDPEKLKKNEKKEIEKYFACQNDSELNRAIAGLLRAERIEEMTNDVKPLFTTEMSKKESTLPGSELNNFQDLTMITYTSTTKPA